MFSIICAHDLNGNIGYNNKLIFHYKKDMNRFKKITTETNNKNKINAVIMGRITYESIPDRFRPLQNRINIILSRDINKINSIKTECLEKNIKNVIVKSSVDEVIKYINNNKNIEKSFIIGGEQIYNLFLNNNLVNDLFITKVDKIFNGDTKFATNSIHNFKLVKCENNFDKNILDNGSNETDLLAFNYYIFNNKEEHNYLNSIKNILSNGIIRNDRTGIGSKSIFGQSFRYNVRNGIIPLLTTKKIFFRGVVEELLWMISGSTDVQKLQEKKVHIWDGNSTREFLDSRNLYHLDEGDIGPGYGHQLRHFNAEYIDCKTNYKGKGFDQIKYIIDLIKNEPNSRRILFCYWNPTQLDLMALPPCHIMYTFYVDTNNNEINLKFDQRSCDAFHGLPFNIASATLLLNMICYLTNYSPGEIYHTISDMHIYSSHIQKCYELLEREPRIFPKLKINNNNKPLINIEDFCYENFEIINYHPYNSLKVPMVV